PLGGPEPRFGSRKCSTSPPGSGEPIYFRVVDQFSPFRLIEARLNVSHLPFLNVQIAANRLVQDKSTISLHGLCDGVQRFELLRIEAKAYGLFFHTALYYNKLRCNTRAVHQQAAPVGRLSFGSEQRILFL